VTATPDEGPRLTIGIPVFNGERHLAETLAAILAQDFTDFEVIVSDNASTDRTTDIAAAFAARDPRVRLVRNAKNIGAVANYNQLVEMARGSYFKWASDDDLLAPTYVSSCVAVLDREPDAVLAYGKTRLIDDAGQVIRDHRDGMHLPSPLPWVRLRDFATHRWLCSPIFGVIRTSVLRTTFLGPGDSADVTFLAQVSLAGRVLEVPEYLFFRRVTMDSRGLGDTNAEQDAEWFGTARQPRRGMPMARVFIDIMRSIRRADLSWPARLHTSWSFAYAWNKRQAGIAWWRLRRRLRRRPRTSFARAVTRLDQRTG
jgi:glycosyltransferase involved in cell wall biosynthesis